MLPTLVWARRKLWERGRRFDAKAIADCNGPVRQQVPPLIGNRRAAGVGWWTGVGGGCYLLYFSGVIAMQFLVQGLILMLLLFGLAGIVAGAPVL